MTCRGGSEGETEPRIEENGDMSEGESTKEVKIVVFLRVCVRERERKGGEWW